MTEKALAQITKLIPMLSSDQDGEVVAAVRAIGRTLKSGGYDWHDFAARFAQPQTAQRSAMDEYADLMRKMNEQQEAAKRAQAQQQQQAKRPGEHDYSDDGPIDSDWERVVAYTLKYGRFTDKEREFIVDMQYRILRGRTPTDRQGGWLGDLYRRTRFQMQQAQAGR